MKYRQIHKGYFRRLLLIGVLSVLAVAQSFAQYVSDGGRFQVDEVKGCAPLTITGADLSGAAAVGYIYVDEAITFNQVISGTLEGNTHTFSQSGKYKIFQVIQGSVVGDSIAVEIFDLVVPTFTVAACTGNNVLVDITDIHYDQYAISYGDGNTIVFNNGDVIPPYTYVPPVAMPNIAVQGRYIGAANNCGIDTEEISTFNLLPKANISLLTSDQAQGEITLDYTKDPNITYRLKQAKNGTATFSDIGLVTDPGTKTITGLNNSNDYYCYKITAEDACSSPPVDSDIICSIVLSTTAENNNNKVNWKTEGNNFNSYQVLKGGAVLANIVDVNTKTLDDSNVRCTEDYCYQVVQNYTTGAKSVSGEDCVTAISTDMPDAVLDVTASVVDNRIELDWDLPAGFNPTLYSITKSVNGSPFSKIAEEVTATFIDESVDVNNSRYCYAITYIDECNNTSPDGVEVCPVLLSMSSTTEEAQLNWTNYQGWGNGINEYILEIYDGEGNLIEEVFKATDTTYLDNLLLRNMQVVAYRIRTVSNDASPNISYSNIVKLTNPIIVFAPNAFTPDGNGLNDSFQIRGRYIKHFELHILNRWGELMFRSNDLDVGWDGNLRGAPVPQGTYVYRANVTDFMGNKTVKSGSLALIRR